MVNQANAFDSRLRGSRLARHRVHFLNCEWALCLSLDPSPASWVVDGQSRKLPPASMPVGARPTILPCNLLVIVVLFPGPARSWLAPTSLPRCMFYWLKFESKLPNTLSLSRSFGADWLRLASQNGAGHPSCVWQGQALGQWPWISLTVGGDEVGAWSIHSRAHRLSKSSRGRGQSHPANLQQLGTRSQRGLRLLGRKFPWVGTHRCRHFCFSFFLLSFFCLVLNIVSAEKELKIFSMHLLWNTGKKKFS